MGLLDGKIIFDEKSENINKSNLEKIYVLIWNKKILNLKLDNKDKNFENYLKPQWSWKTLVTIGIFCFCF